MKMLESMVNGAKKIGVGLALAGALVAGPKVDAATNVVYGVIPESASVTNGQSSYIDLYFGSGLNLLEVAARITFGNVGFDTNTLRFIGGTIFASPPGYVATDGGFIGQQLHALSYACQSNGLLIADVATANLTSTTGTNYFARWSFNVFYTGTSDYQVNLTPSFGQAVDDFGVLHTSDGSADPGIGDDPNSVFNLIGRGSSVTVKGIPEPSALALVLAGLGGLYLLNGLKKRK